MRFALYHDMRTEIHKLAQKPQARPKTTKTAKNHKDGKNHIIGLLRFCGRFVGATLAILHAVRYAHGTRISLGFDAPMRGFWRLFPFLTRSALRAIQKPQSIHKTTKPHAKTTRDPQAKNR